MNTSHHHQFPFLNRNSLIQLLKTNAEWCNFHLIYSRYCCLLLAPRNFVGKIAREMHQFRTSLPWHKNPFESPWILSTLVDVPSLWKKAARFPHSPLLHRAYSSWIIWRKQLIASCFRTVKDYANFFSNKPTVKNEELVTLCSAAYIQKISFFWSKSSTLTVLRIYNISD